MFSRQFLACMISVVLPFAAVGLVATPASAVSKHHRGHHHLASLHKPVHKVKAHPTAVGAVPAKTPS